MSEELDWVVLKEDVGVYLIGKHQIITKGTTGRVLRCNDDGTVNVSFGMSKGVHPLNPIVLKPRD